MGLRQGRGGDKTWCVNMDGHFVPNIETIDAFNGSDLEAQILCGLLSINVNVKSGCVPN